jgi:hypothetical protein
MRNYWFNNEEADIFPGGDTFNLSTVMSWRRFIYIRSNLAFRGEVSAKDMQRDPTAKNGPLISMLKKRCSQHVITGRNVAVDEASSSCRSKYARHLIVFNPRKPTEKYHFKLDVCSCPTTWIVLGFKLHSVSDRSRNIGSIGRAGNGIVAQDGRGGGVVKSFGAVGLWPPKTQAVVCLLQSPTLLC